MSLKSFHIVFILASIGLSLGFGVWCLKTPGVERAYGWGAFVLGGALVLYGFWFLKKALAR